MKGFAEIESYITQIDPGEIVSRVDAFLEETKIWAEAGQVSAQPSLNQLSGQSDRALAVAFQALTPWVSFVEQRQPGHMAGKKKIAHMKEMIKEVPEMTAFLGLDPKEATVLKLLSLHDVGRPPEACLRWNSQETGRRHGVLSAWFLVDNLVLKELPPDIQYIILYAAYWHSEKTVPSPEGASQLSEDAYRFCYILRDLDKWEFLSNPVFRAPEGILSEVQAHYLSPQLNTLVGSQPEIRDQCLRFVAQNLVLGNSAQSQEHDFPERFPLELKARLVEIASRGFDELSWAAFSTQDPVDYGRIKYSWATYLLAQLAQLFDIHERGVLSQIWENREAVLVPKLALMARTEPDKTTRATETLTDFFSTRLEAPFLPPLMT
ncbi:MAG: hypothetical protein JW991_02285 [Candidatus Pacebacteria bacterium]|nr:hypothetical protein [Candidatus Paceibacterota bacterium]